MEFATSAASTIIGEYLLKPTINQVRYLFCFNNIVEELDGAEEQLQAARHDVEDDVKRAHENTEKIKEVVQVCVKSTSKTLEEVQILKRKIEVNKTCLHGWCPNLGCRYWLGRQAAKKTSIMLKLIDGGKFETVGNRASLLEREFSAPKDFDLFPSSKSSSDKIIEALKNDNTHMVILYGMGGAGKTTLAKAVGNKVKADGMFPEIVMATVSQTPNFRDIQGRLADSLDLKLEEESDEGRADRLFLRFSNAKNKILVILDDVWKEFDLKKEIGIPLSKDCKILLTTRNQHVCPAKEGQSLIQLNVLNEDEGVALLKKRAGIVDESSEFNDWAIQIARECGGLPLALATIGNALKGREITEWQVVCEKLRKSKFEDIQHVITTEKSVYAIIKWSYDYLKDEKMQLCFLLCSLFPEDFEISLEELGRYEIGLSLFGVENIREARMELQLMVKHLKALGLLLDARGEEFVKMHDLVRDVALWIASKGKNVFMSKTGMSSRDWSNVKGGEQYTAISSTANKIAELPSGLVCPKLEILLLSGMKYYNQLKVSDEYFKEMKEVKVVTLSYVQNLSLQSLQFLTNLKTLELINCNNFKDISSLGKLNELEILSLKDSYFDELPKELGDLIKLRLLDLRGCYELKRIPANVIPRLSQLEELYMGGSFKDYWAAEEASEDGRNASLSELSSLSQLTILSLRIKPDQFAENFLPPELVKYDILVSPFKSYVKSIRSPNALSIIATDANLMIVFKALYQTLEYLVLKCVTGCQNVFPTIDQGGLIKLRSLEIDRCPDLKCVIDMSQGQVPANTFSSLETIEVRFCDNICSLFSAMLRLRLHKLNTVIISACNNLQEIFQLEGPFHTGEENFGKLSSLTKLELKDLPELRCIWKGHTQHVSLKSLTVVEVTKCGSLKYLFTMSLAQSLVQLKSLMIRGCDSLEHLVFMEKGDNNKEDNIWLQEVFQLEGPFHTGEENLGKLSSLTKLELEDLPQLRCIWKGHTQHVSVKSLTVVKVTNCGSLKYLFTMSLVQSLVQLKSLMIKDCDSLERLVFTEEGDNNDEEEILINPLFFSKLESILIDNCEMLEYIFPVSIAGGLVQLEELTVGNASQLKGVFYLDHGGEENVVAGDGKEIVLPNLKRFPFRELANCISFCPENYHSTWPALEEIRTENCPNLTISFGQDVKEKLRVVAIQGCHQLCDETLSQLRHGGLPNLEEFAIDHCRAKVIFQLEGLVVDGHELTLSLPSLKNLSLRGLEELEDLYKGPARILNLQNLTSLWVSDCQRLKHIFSPTLAQNLLQLRSLNIIKCGELEQLIVEDDDEEDQTLLKDHLQRSFFPNLSVIAIRKCHKLKCLFPVTMARSLQQLRDLIVDENFQLEEVFGYKKEADIMDCKEILMPKLQVLTLMKLPSLTNFCLVGYHFIFPYLTFLTVKDCPKRMTRFSFAQNKSVHAQVKLRT